MIIGGKGGGGRGDGGGFSFGEGRLAPSTLAIFSRARGGLARLTREEEEEKTAEGMERVPASVVAAAWDVVAVCARKRGEKVTATRAEKAKGRQWLHWASFLRTTLS